MHDPQVLLMDEPFTGLDPVNIVLLREAILELRDRGKTVVLSTHQMETVEAMCELVAIVDHGGVVAGGTLRRRQAVDRAADGPARARRGDGAGVAGRAPRGRLRAPRTGLRRNRDRRRASSHRRSWPPRSPAGRRSTGSRWRTRASRCCSSNTSAGQPTTPARWASTRSSHDPPRPADLLDDPPRPAPAECPDRRRT